MNVFVQCKPKQDSVQAMSLLWISILSCLFYHSYCSDRVYRLFELQQARSNITYQFTVINDNYIKKLPEEIDWSADPIEIIAWDHELDKIYFQFKVRLPGGYWYKLFWRKSKSGPWTTATYSPPFYQPKMPSAVETITPIHNSKFTVLQCRIVGKKTHKPEPPYIEFDITSNIRGFGMVADKYLQEQRLKVESRKR